ncbi:MAG TPA: sigma-70 family RNA polymerase sigma factor [Streptosporangiaceae bacterium]
MRDSEIVAAIVARDPDGLAHAYDKYAARLYGFCRSLLREPADAADAVQDTFLIAASKLGELRDPDRLRPWLYAVARNECHRRLRAGNAPAALDETTELADDSADASDLAARAELRDLVRAAIMGLNPGDQEVIELSLRHDLHGADLADALGVPRNHAHALASRARGQLEKSLGALLVARAGRDACPALASLLPGWDRATTITVLTRKRVSRHIEGCEVCSERKRRELRPVMLFGFAPLAIIPAALRARMLHLAADPAAAAAAERSAIVQHAARFGAHGFPVATAATPAPGVTGAVHAALGRAGRRWPLGHGHTAVIAGSAAAAVVVGVTAVLVMVVPQTTHQGSTSAGSPGPARTTGRPTAAVRPAARKPTTTRSDPSPGAAGALAQQRVSRPARPARPAPAGGGRAGVTGAPGAAAGDAPGAAATGGGGDGSTAPAPGPATTAPAPAPAVNGPVTVSPGTLVLAGLLSASATGTLTLSAGGTPVTHYAISIPSSLLGHLTVSPATGSIPAHGRQQVAVILKGLLSVDTTITVNPGGHQVSVLLGVHIGG